eukprot:m.482254 g.482254  ORF g.482254 m.482254 type:complete len:402 (+) comp22481_c0_seq1:353-1558(+)
MAAVRGRLVTLATLVVLLGSGGDGATEQAIANGRYSGTPTCKDDYLLFTDTAAGILGCYVFSNAAVSWLAAKTACEADNGKLAAARTTNEHEFLMSLAVGQRFWTAGSSLEASDLLWRWDGYGEAIDIEARFFQTKVKKASEWPDQSVLLDGNVVTPAWTQMTQAAANAASHRYICRKDACPAGQDVSSGLCVELAAATSEDKSWVGAIVLLIVLFALALGLIALFYLKRPIFDKIFPCFKEKKKSKRVEPQELVETHMTAGGERGVGETASLGSRSQRSSAWAEGDGDGNHPFMLGNDVLMPPPVGLPSLKAPPPSAHTHTFGGVAGLPPIRAPGAGAARDAVTIDNGAVASINNNTVTTLPPPAQLPSHHQGFITSMRPTRAIDADNDATALPGATLRD